VALTISKRIVLLVDNGGMANMKVGSVGLHIMTTLLRKRLQLLWSDMRAPYLLPSFIFVMRFLDGTTGDGRVVGVDFAQVLRSAPLRALLYE
jgi:hypothetical protein